MLVNVVGNIRNNPEFVQVPVMCHNATLYWLYTAEFGRPPTLNQYASPPLSIPTPIIQSMLPSGTHLQNAGALGAVADGSIVVFVENNEPKHSCVALPFNRIGGFNQTGWFTTNGVGGRYSIHNRSEVIWLQGFTQRGKVRGSVANMHCKLIAIPENIAKARLRLAVQ